STKAKGIPRGSTVHMRAIMRSAAGARCGSAGQGQTDVGRHGHEARRRPGPPTISHLPGATRRPKLGRPRDDNYAMNHNILMIAIMFLAGMGLCLYIMRRRSRLGRR